jgi:hypothetical protein
MTQRLFILMLLSCAACRTGSLGACDTDAQCPTGAVCDPAAKVCLLTTVSSCSPACATGFSCVNNACVSSGVCTPACDSSHTCDVGTLQCIPNTAGTAVISLRTDGRTTHFGVGQTATIIASVSGSNVSSVNLEIDGHAAFAGVAGPGSAYTFTVPIDATFAATGATTPVPFSVLVIDATGATRLSNDPAEVIRVDRDAPAITAITIVTAADFTGSQRFFKGGGSPLSITASIADEAGIAADSVCLRVAGETGACAHPGTAGASNSFGFSLPRPGSGFDGTALTFTISANDSLTATLTTAIQPEHQATSAPQQVFFDTTAPAITIAPDSKIYARTLPGGAGDLIPVIVQITDGTGVVTPLLNGTVAPTAKGDTFVFLLDARGVPAGREGALSFTISAKDPLGNTSSATGSVNIDGAAPAAALKVFQGSDEPAGGGVTYPLPVAGTGHTGDMFVYSDVVHVKGTLSDESGIAGAALHIDGIALDGGVSAGVVRPLTCTAGANSCDFDVQIALNDPQNGAFHTGATTTPVGNLQAPFGALQVSIDATDQATQVDGGLAANTGTTKLAASATRLLWFLQLDGAAAVTGLAVHPNGDVIATTSGATNSVFDLAPDAPLQRWTFAAGAVPGSPSIGSDSAAAPVYVVAQTGNIYALASDGGVAGHAVTGTNVSVGPAVASATWPGGVGVADEVLVPDNVSNAGSSLWSVGFDGGFFGKVSNNEGARTSDDPPMVFDGGVWVGTNRGVTFHNLPGNGTTIGGFTRLAGTNPNEFFGPITNGTNVYASGVTQNSIFAFNGARAALTNLALGAAPLALPTIGIDGRLYTGDALNELVAFTPATQARAAILTGLPGGVRVPLQGSDGHIYLPRDQSFLFALENGQTSWSFDPQGNIFRGGILDCSGRLFIASDGSVYAFVTDDHGLADTAWPSIRRDSRNTGNASALKYGIRTAAGCKQ